MKYILYLILILNFQKAIAQNIILEFSPSLIAGNGILESEFSQNESFSDFHFLPRISTSFDLNLYCIMKNNLGIKLGIGISKYKYDPKNEPRFPNQHNGNGGFFEIGFDMNGLLENSFYNLSLGLEQKINSEKTAVYPQIYLQYNNAYSQSPLYRDTDFNNTFFIIGIGFGMNIVNLKMLEFNLFPYLELKPYHKKNDHAYSNEKIFIIGIGFSTRFDLTRNSKGSSQ